MSSIISIANLAAEGGASAMHCGRRGAFAFFLHFKAKVAAQKANKKTNR